MRKRGQAALPDLELILIECGLQIERLSTMEGISEQKSLSGQEGRLAPAQGAKDEHRIKQTSYGRN